MSEIKNTDSEVVTQETEVNEEDDNTLINAEDLKTDEPETEQLKPSKWDDPEILKKLAYEMEQLGKVRFKKIEFTDEILTKAMAEVLGDHLGWTDYDSFSETVRQILQGPRNGPNRIPFSLKTRNKRTGNLDFWLVRSFVQIEGSVPHEYFDDDGNSIPKKTVLMSRQFSNFLRNFCKSQLKDEVHFWIFTGTFKGKQNLDLDKLIPEDREMLLPDQNSNNMVMVQFKMKTPEEMIGAKR